MQTKSLPYLEDYLEVISGVAGFPFGNPNPNHIVITLARYDVQIVHSMALQTAQGISLTDRQALLAHKLVVKYRRQLAAQGLDLGVHEDNAVFRLPVRMVDRTRSIKLQDQQIHIRFPYDEALVNDIKQSAKTTPGSLHFDSNTKTWTGSITEPRLIWLQHLVDKYNFQADEQITQLIQQVEQCQQQKYRIELTVGEHGLEIANAESSLVDYINENLGGFDVDNITQLIDYSSVLGYTVSAELVGVLTSNPRIQRLLTERDVHLPLSGTNAIKDIVEYANLSNRWPMFVFENNGSPSDELRAELDQVFAPEEILYVKMGQRKPPDTTGYRCVYLSHWNSNWNMRIPLLVTMTALMVGVKKIQIVQHSEKVVFGTAVVYNQV